VQLFVESNERLDEIPDEAGEGMQNGYRPILEAGKVKH